MKRAFTVIELLAVTAILAVLAMLLFPVLTSARAAAKSAACISNLHQVALSTTLYLADYEDRFMTVSHNPDAINDPKRDRTWVQLLLPYMRSFAAFQCPADYGNRENADGVFDHDLAPGDTYARFYAASMRSDVGFNYLYLSPVLKVRGQWDAEPRFLSQIENLTATILYADSVWSRDAAGRPYGGGNYLIVPPCRFERMGNEVVDTFGSARGLTQYFTTTEGWKDEPTSPFVYGGAWPWHSGRVNVARVDGSVRSHTPAQLTAGCDAVSDWRGLIEDAQAYLWDLR